jgi:hypothetical protein
MYDSFRVILSCLRRCTRTASLILITLLVSGVVSAQQQSLPVQGGGTLEFTITTSGTTVCSQNPLTYYVTIQYLNFVYVDASGVSHPLSGGIYERNLEGPGGGANSTTPGCPIAVIPTTTGGYDSNGIAPLTATDGSGFSTNLDFEVDGEGDIYDLASVGTFSANLLPKYYILSILYAPPGNSSSNGFSDSTSNGTSTSTTHTFNQNTSLSWSIGGSFFAGAHGGSSFGIGAGSGSSQSFQETYTGSQGAGLKSTNNLVDHTQDQFYLWLNPMVTYTMTGTSTTVTTTMGTPNGQPMDIVNVNAEDLMNPTQIPLGVLTPQTVYNPTTMQNVTLPGLSSICANPLPTTQCTQSNACGCVASDFATILAQNPLIGTSQTTSPSSVDSNRYVLIDTETLEGPECSGCDPGTYTFTESDSTTQGTTESETNSYSVGSSIGSEAGWDLGPLKIDLSFTETNTLTWTNSQSYGTSNGQSHQASITFGTSSLDCYEHIDIFEDTVYHTFAFMPTTTPPAQCQ